MSDPKSLLKWSEFAPELKEFNAKLLENGYDDISLLLLDPSKQEDWTEFVEFNELLPGTKLKFRDKIIAFRQQNPDQVHTVKGKTVKEIKKQGQSKTKSVKQQIEATDDIHIKEKRITQSQDASNLAYEVVFKDSMISRVSECKKTYNLIYIFISSLL